jgi:capsular exopolysaccharide synthesis family protein
MICASLNVAQASKPFKLVMYTSALAGEGKSTIISNVAIHLAQSGKRILLVDLNVHRPVLAQRFHLKCEVGLTNMLAKKSKRLSVEQYSQDTSFVGLQVLAAGTQAMNSSEFLRSLATADFFPRLKQAPFDYVLFDTPPLFAVAEAQILASSIEALVLVVNGARTPRRVLARTRQLLWRMQTTRVLGVIVNQSSWRDYADTHPYALPLPRQASEQQFTVEEVTLELPAVTMRLITAPTQVIEQGDLPLLDTGPDTGETEHLNSESSERVIHPPFSLSGLMMPTNGLTGRTCSGDIATPVPPSLQNLS